MEKKCYTVIHLFIDEEGTPSSFVDVYGDFDAAVKELDREVEYQKIIEKETFLDSNKYNMEICMYLIPYFKSMGNPKYLSIVKSKSIYHSNKTVKFYRAIFETKIR